MAIRFELTPEQRLENRRKAAETKRATTARRYKGLVEKIQGLDGHAAAKVLSCSLSTVRRIRRWERTGVLD